VRQKTISEIRREAGLKSGEVRRANAMRDPLTTVSIRQSSHQVLRKLADAKGETMTETLHALIQSAQLDRQLDHGLISK
jgi:hypothetical protein